MLGGLSSLNNLNEENAMSNSTELATLLVAINNAINDVQHAGTSQANSIRRRNSLDPVASKIG